LADGFVTQQSDITCPKCQHGLDLGPDERGKPVACPQCGHSFMPNGEGGQPLLSILQQLEELQRELTAASPAAPASEAHPASGSEGQVQLPAPSARSVVTEELERITRELDAVRGERDQLFARQQALSLEAAQLRILVSEFEQVQNDAATARLTAFRGLTRALDAAQSRWEG